MGVSNRGQEWQILETYLDGHHIVLSGEYWLVIQDAKGGWIRPVHVQTASVDRPHKITFEDKT